MVRKIGIVLSDTSFDQSFKEEFFINVILVIEGILVILLVIEGILVILLALCIITGPSIHPHFLCVCGGVCSKAAYLLKLSACRV